MLSQAAGTGPHSVRARSQLPGLAQIRADPWTQLTVGFGSVRLISGGSAVGRILTGPLSPTGAQWWCSTFVSSVISHRRKNSRTLRSPAPAHLLVVHDRVASSPAAHPCTVSPPWNQFYRATTMVSVGKKLVDLMVHANKAVRESRDPIHFCYPSVDNLVNLVRLKGPGCCLLKCDISQVYRQLLVDPGDLHLLGYKWKGGSFIDVTLTMGLRSAAFWVFEKVFIAVSNMLLYHWCQHQ